MLALQGDVREHLNAFTQAGADVSVVRRAIDLDAIDALALPGGESTTMSRLIRTFALEDALRARIEGGMPCFATCAGLILMAREVADSGSEQICLGGIDVIVRRNAFGRQVDSFEAPIPVTGLEEPFPGMFIRAPLIESAGPTAQVIAEYDGNIVAVRQGATLGLSFHPEMTADLRLHRLFLDGMAGRTESAA